MFVKAIKDNRSGRDGYYCSLVISQRVNGKPVHRIVQSFGYVSRERLPYLRAAFNDGNPEEILIRELDKIHKEKY